MVNWLLTTMTQLFSGGKNQWCCDDWISTCKIMKLDPYLTPTLKMSSDGSDPNVKNKSIKITGHIDINLCMFVSVRGFLDMKLSTCNWRKKYINLTSS